MLNDYHFIEIRFYFIFSLVSVIQAFKKSLKIGWLNFGDSI